MFQCTPTGPYVGHPHRAKTCRCHDPMPDEDGLCTACGYWPAEVVAETFRRQALLVAVEAKLVA